jgi:uncharacterized RDD family membrane protein YckC
MMGLLCAFTPNPFILVCILPLFGTEEFILDSSDSGYMIIEILGKETFPGIFCSGGFCF